MTKRERGVCPECGSGQVNHLVIGMPVFPPGESTPEWVKFVGCVVTPESRSRYCENCEYSWNP